MEIKNIITVVCEKNRFGVKYTVNYTNYGKGKVDEKIDGGHPNAFLPCISKWMEKMDIFGEDFTGTITHLQTIHEYSVPLNNAELKFYIKQLFMYRPEEML